jgi:hypothetical protein
MSSWLKNKPFFIQREEAGDSTKDLLLTTYINAQYMLSRMKYKRIYSVAKKLERPAKLEIILILIAI